jgi:hypothetical protein
LRPIVSEIGILMISFPLELELTLSPQESNIGTKEHKTNIKNGFLKNCATSKKLNLF